jgi:GTP-binding protein
MIDLIRLHLRAGDGGYGRISFHREKFITKGGPDGGNGGMGGKIILKAAAGMNTLRSLSGIKHIKAQSGNPGGREKMSGLKGDSVTIEVPVGTVVWLAGENKISAERTRRYGVRQLLAKADIQMEKFYVTKEQEPAPAREPDQPEPITEHLAEYEQMWQVTGNVPAQKKFGETQTFWLAELTEVGQTITLCQGGLGGRGNFLFKASTNVTPLEAEYGSFGEQKEVFLELRLLADVGLVGLPNAGKSTLLSKITKATPKIGDYPFTTIEPNLGVLTMGKQGAEFAQVGNKSRRDLVIADIPGLIEGASEGKGLGFDFLRHIENCQELVYVLTLPEAVIFDETLSVQEKAEQVWQQYQALRTELGQHNASLLEKPYILTLNKIDIYSNELIDAVIAIFTHHDEVITPFSGVTGQGLAEVITLIGAVVPAATMATADEAKLGSTQTETAEIEADELE